MIWITALHGQQFSAVIQIENCEQNVISPAQFSINEIILFEEKTVRRDTALNDIFKGGGQLVPPLSIEFDTTGGRQMIQCLNTIGDKK